MSLNNQALRDLVAERLVVAADEIFALFEQTFAQYKEELLRSKLMQQPRVVLCRKDVQTVAESEKNDSNQVANEEPIEIKEEVDPPVKLHFPSVTLKSEETQLDGEEPSCSFELISDNETEPFSCSDSNEFFDWEFLVEKRDGTEVKQEKNVSPVKKVVKDDVNGEASLSRDAVQSVNRISRNVLHKCFQCSEKFKTIEALEVHHDIHPGPYTCQLCDKNFSFKRLYKKHLKGHDEPKPFKCAVCKHKFRTKYHLNEHVLIHTGERPFSCSECDMKFRQRNSLIRHFLAKHSEDKPYRCSVCQKGFVQKWHYVSHMRGHTEEGTFRSSDCAQKIKIKLNLKKHLRTRKADDKSTSQVEDN
ncbi:hypothetical protein WMY93_007046 [Mugilogobius chulae]|uniref:C2H2-type domain-containing protein n=1 Tax=Mugilogobius chulae TaxID=88201 RepID=A0AAW0PP27_9GOBI